MAKTMKRSLALMLAIFLIFTMLPTVAFAESSVEIAIDIVTTAPKTEEYVYFNVNTTVSNVESVVHGKLSITPDADDTKTEYYDDGEAAWVEFSGEYGPAEGFAIASGTTRFRAKFASAGTYTVCADILTEDRSEVICEDSKQIEVKQDAVVTTNIGDRVTAIGTEFFFDVTTAANKDAGRYVIGSFELGQPDAVESLKYYEDSVDMWLPLSGDFGPVGGFPLSDATSHFSVIFKNSGIFDYRIVMKDAVTGDTVCETGGQITVVDAESAELTQNAAEQTFVEKQATEFEIKVTDLTTDEVQVTGAIAYKEGTEASAFQKLEYYDAASGWTAITEDNTFGGTGFKITEDASIRLRATFAEAGEYGITVALNNAGSGTIVGTVDVDFTVLDAWTVSVTETPEDKGTVTLNGDEINSLTVQDKAQVTLSVEAEENYRISSVKVDGDEKLSKLEESFTLNLTAAKDISVAVSYVKVYTMTVTVSENGTVTTTPELESGSVEITEGEKFTLTATPNEYYRVESVKINDTDAPDFKAGENDLAYTAEFTPEDDMSFEIVFAPNRYKVSAVQPANGSITIDSSNEPQTVEYGDSVNIKVTANRKFYINRVTAEIDGKIIEIEVDENGEYTLKNITGDVIVRAEISNINYITVNPMDNDYYTITCSNDSVRQFTNAAGQTVLVVEPDTTLTMTPKTENGYKVIKYNELGKYGNSYTVSGSILIENITVAKKVNDWNPVFTTANLLFVIDKAAPTGSLKEAEDAPAVYHEDATLTVEASDPAYSIDDNTVENACSGIASVSYTVTAGGETLDSVDVYTRAENEDLSSYSGKIKLSAEKYSQKTVSVILTVTDCAGRTFTTEENPLELSFDTSEPAVTITVADDTAKADALPGYYNQRIFTVKVEEWAVSHNDKGLTLVDGKTVIDLTDMTKWTATDTGYEAEITFEDDGTYSGTICYTNNAGVQVQAASTGIANLNEFTIDTEEPTDLSVDYSKSFSEGILNKITFGFYKGSADVTVSAKDAPSGIAKFVYTYTDENGTSVTVSSEDEGSNPIVPEDGDIYSFTFTIPAQFRGQVSFEAFDKAGNMTSSLTKDGENTERTVVADTVAPGITVEYFAEGATESDADTVKNGKYYDHFRTAKIIINEDNFFGTAGWTNEDGNEAPDYYDLNPETNKPFLQISVKKTSTDGTETVETLMPEFDDKDGVYSATVSFKEDGTYTFDISCSDRSGNLAEYTSGEFVIDTSVPTVNVSYNPIPVYNGKYFNQDRIATVEVESYTFDPNDNVVLNSIVAEVTKGGAETNEYAELLKTADKWTSTGDNNTYKIELPFTEDAAYVISDIRFTNLAGTVSELYYDKNDPAPKEFVVDHKKPENLTVSYSTPFSEGILDATTFGFYKESIDVTVSATDAPAGVDYFVCTYTDEDGTVQTVKATGEQIVPEDGDIYSFTFTIPAQFRGQVSFEATDMANNTASSLTEDGENTEPTVVADTVAPGITVEYYIKGSNDRDENKVKNEKYYDHFRTAKIIINEANFFGTADWTNEDGNEAPDYYDLNPETNKPFLQISVKKTSTDGTETVETLMPQFDGKDGVYSATVPFEEDGTYTFDISCSDRSGNLAEYTSGEFVIDTSVPTVNVSYNPIPVYNGKYFNQDRIATVTVVSYTFDPTDNVVINSIVAAVTKDGTDTDEFVQLLKTADKWTSTGDNNTYKIELPFTEDAAYVISDIRFTNLAGTVSELYYDENDPAPDDFVVDHKKPENLTVSYSTPFSEGILNKTTFGFYKESIDVTVSATDAPAGVHDFVCTYTDEDGTVQTVKATGEQIVPEDGDIYSFTFTIPAQFRGQVAFEATDMANNTASSLTEDGENTEQTVVADTVAPGITVEYFNLDTGAADASTVKNGMYFDHDRQVKITIAEDNFFGTKDWTNEDDNKAPDYYDLNPETNKPFLQISVKKPSTDGTETVETLMPTFTEEADGKYAAYIDFDEDDDYTLSILCTDRSGNKAKTYTNEFVIDTVNPEIVVSYENNTVYNGKYFHAKRTATVTITERNFNGADTKITGPDGKMQLGEWSHNGSTHKATVTFSKDGDYTFAISCTDLANRTTEDKNVTYKGEAPKEFTIDTIAPKITVSYDNNDVDSEKYFKANRTATVTIVERNFDPSGVNANIVGPNGRALSLSGWTNSGDNHTATVRFTEDGDYTFAISCTDLAKHTTDDKNVTYKGVAPKEFTIDKTAPVITVVYDNNDVSNGNYYKKARTATVTITERNFGTDRINITLTATNDGAPAQIPAVNGWTNNGNTHTATIVYPGDALYTFDIAYTDKAGNAAVDFDKQSFYVDTTAPVVEITGVENKSANSGSVIPVITFSDVNFTDNTVEIVLTGANNGDVEPTGTYSSIRNGTVFTFADFPETKDTDDIYTLTATMTDKAGNQTTQSITFSVNRFGSTYVLSPDTAALNGTYVQEPEDVVITEINADRLSNIEVTVFKNNETVTLKEGEDYEVAVSGGNGEWYEYVYTIFADNFADDGVYRLSLHSEDATGHVSENTLDTKQTEFGFGVDKTKPTASVTNIEKNTTYAVDSITAILLANDNLRLNTVEVYLDDDSKIYKSWTAEEISEILSGNGEFTFDISGDSSRAHKLRIVCKDAAGNEEVVEIDNFYVTTNLLVRYYNNKPLFFGSLAGVAALTGFIIFLIGKKKKDDDEEGEA